MKNKAKRCGVKKSNGKECRAFCIKGEDTCFFHSPEADAARKKGRDVMSQDAKEIRESLARLDLRSPDTQKKHLSHLILKAIDNNEKYGEIARLYTLLIAITKESDPTQKIEMHYTVMPPGAKGSE